MCIQISVHIFRTDTHTHTICHTDMMLSYEQSGVSDELFRFAPDDYPTLFFDTLWVSSGLGEAPKVSQGDWDRLEAGTKTPPWESTFSLFTCTSSDRRGHFFPPGKMLGGLTSPEI